MSGARGRSMAARFWEKVSRRGSDECWPWTAGGNGDRYGRFRVGGRYGSNVGAHRVAYELAKGPIGPGLMVMHSCDNPPCCNPAHLTLGTHTDNMRDMASKGRAPDQVGSKGHNAKLTEADVTAIRQACAHGEPQKSVAARYGISKGSTCDIVNCVTWTHVADPAPAIRAERDRAKNEGWDALFNGARRSA